jgi:hypothetical protein
MTSMESNANRTDRADSAIEGEKNKRTKAMQTGKPKSKAKNGSEANIY